MAFSLSVAVCDACILYPFHLRNIIVQASVDRLFHARWTDTIHDEWMRNLVAKTPGLSIDRLEATKRLMDVALPHRRAAGALASPWRSGPRRRSSPERSSQ